MKVGSFLIVVALIFVSCAKPSDDTPSSGDLVMAGGETTHNMRNSFSYSTPASNLTKDQLELHLAGDVAFNAIFVTGAAAVNGGLGPIYNQTSCISCHIKDGRGQPPVDGNKDLGALLLRISLPGVGTNGSPVPVPGFGLQLQNRAIFGGTPEGKVSTNFVDSLITFLDGEQAVLKHPRYLLEDSYIPLPANLLASPRIAPPIFGLGLLEAIDESTILALADENDVNQDGISGKANYVWDLSTNRVRIGRFGWKANQPTLLQQNAAAYNGDMGITSPMFSNENCTGQINCSKPNALPEIDMKTLDLTTFYTQTLGVPAARNTVTGEVIRGRAIFSAIGCAHCHLSKITTGSASIPQLSNQIIAPYTDLLLHDMGKDLADNRPDHLANGREWRTAPLWGIGLTKIVNGHTRFLHDGRARNLNEAILWHGGEAEQSKKNFMKLSAQERKELLYFLENL